MHKNRVNIHIYDYIITSFCINVPSCYDYQMNRFLKLILLILLAVIFLPAFFIVTYLNKTWAKLIKEVFGPEPFN